MTMIPFNQPKLLDGTLERIAEAFAHRKTSGDGEFTRRCEAILREVSGGGRALLTGSCTHALEMAGLLLDLCPGDEVIVPSYTFVTTASAFAMRGARLVFVDIRPDTLNIDERLVEAAITAKTKAIVVVHYGGVGCEMDRIGEIASRHGIATIEDNAHGLFGTYRGRPLGAMGRFSTLSFHETKNISCGEGGAMLVNEQRDLERAEIIREKGTDRSRFFRGQVDKYTWVDLGSSYLMSEISAAVLLTQLERAREITRERLRIWQRYHDGFEDLESAGLLRRPVVPAHCAHAGHLYYVLVPDRDRDRILRELNADGVSAVFHYLPLHESPAGRKFGRASGSVENAVSISAQLVRLPLWFGLSDADVERVIAAVRRRVR